MRISSGSTLAALLLLTLTATAAPALASGGSSAGGGAGGGGGTTTTTTGGGGGGGGGGAKPLCVSTLSVAGTASEALTGNSFTATYQLASCVSKTKVAVTATDLSTGYVVYSNPDTIGTTAIWTLPYELSSYRVDVRAYSTTGTVATASTVVDTLTALQCTQAVAESVTVGYYLTYPAVWASTNANSCGIPNLHTRLRITNLSSGAIAYDTTSTSMSYLVDYEGAIVSYSTPYEIEADLVDGSGSVLASEIRDVVTAPLR